MTKTYILVCPAGATKVGCKKSKKIDCQNDESLVKKKKKKKHLKGPAVHLRKNIHKVVGVATGYYPSVVGLPAYQWVVRP